MIFLMIAVLKKKVSNAVDDNLRAILLVDFYDGLARGSALVGIVYRANIRARKTAALGAVLPVGEHRSGGAGVDLNR